eukprot:169210-Rhodomonas_salina.1
MRIGTYLTAEAVGGGRCLLEPPSSSGSSSGGTHYVSTEHRVPAKPMRVPNIAYWRRLCESYEFAFQVSGRLCAQVMRIPWYCVSTTY